MGMALALIGLEAAGVLSGSAGSASAPTRGWPEAAQWSRGFPGCQRGVLKDGVKGVLGGAEHRCSLSESADCDRRRMCCDRGHQSLPVGAVDAVAGDVYELAGKAADGHDLGIERVHEPGDTAAQASCRVLDNAAIPDRGQRARRSARRD